ncbi:hypothetical protein SALWKB2_0837 [Snodgrassella alvi wkB2]|nr:hypothetical protein SALWKB2_0837 [Snodgrassella alvi wkB2]
MFTGHGDTLYLINVEKGDKGADAPLFNQILQAPLAQPSS